MATKATQQVRVNTTRYLDEDGLEVLWEKIKEYVAENSVTIEGDDIDLAKYVTQEQLEEALANIDTSDIDLSAYQTKEELAVILRGYSKTNHTHSEYLTEHQDLTSYATKSYVTDAINNASLGGGDGTSVDLSIYATKEELSDYATESYVENAIKNAEIDVDLTDYALKSELPDLTSYATQNYVDTAIENASLSGGEVDLSDYATKEYLHDALYFETEQITEDIDNINDRLDDFVTEDQMPSFDEYATKDYVDRKFGTTKYPVDGYVRKEAPIEGDLVKPITAMPAIKTYDGSTILTFDRETTIRIYTGDIVDGYVDDSKYVEYTGTSITIPDTVDGYLTDYVIFNPVEYTPPSTDDPNIFKVSHYGTGEFCLLEDMENAPKYASFPTGWAYKTQVGVFDMDEDELHANMDYCDEVFNKMEGIHTVAGYRLSTDNYNTLDTGNNRGGQKFYVGNADDAIAQLSEYWKGTEYDQLEKVHTMGINYRIQDFNFYKDGRTWVTDEKLEDHVGENGNYAYLISLPPGKTYTIECLGTKMGWRSLNDLQLNKKWGKKNWYATSDIEYDVVDGDILYDPNHEHESAWVITFPETAQEVMSCLVTTTADETGDNGGHFTVNNEHGSISSLQHNFIYLGLKDASYINNVKIVEGTVPYSQLVSEQYISFGVVSKSGSDSSKSETYTLQFSENTISENEYTRYINNPILRYVDIDSKVSNNELSNYLRYEVVTEAPEEQEEGVLYIVIN